MVAGELYHSAEETLVQLRVRARELCQRYNLSRESDLAARRGLLAGAAGKGGESASIQPPFHCDYGFNLRFGESVFINFDCIVLDVCPVTIGDHTMLGPAVQLYTATHPMDAKLRRDAGAGPAGDHRLGLLDRRRGHPLSRGRGGERNSDRRGQRGDAQPPGRGVRGGESVPDHPPTDGVKPRPARTRLSSPGRGDSTSTRFPVTGCVKPSERACKKKRVSPGSAAPP